MMMIIYQVWFSNRRARLRKQAQSCPPSAYNPMGLSMSYHSAATSSYMDSAFSSAAVHAQASSADQGSSLYSTSAAQVQSV